MRIYVIRDAETAKDCRQLIVLKAECAKLQWSKTIKDMPQSVIDSLEVVENYADAKIEELCTNSIAEYELELSEEELFLAAIKTEKMREIFGTGVVFQNDIDEAVGLIDGYDVPTVKKALETNANIVIK